MKIILRTLKHWLLKCKNFLKYFYYTWIPYIIIVMVQQNYFQIYWTKFLNKIILSEYNNKILSVY